MLENIVLSIKWLENLVGILGRMIYEISNKKIKTTVRISEKHTACDNKL